MKYSLIFVLLLLISVVSCRGTNYSDSDSDSDSDLDSDFYFRDSNAAYDTESDSVIEEDTSPEYASVYDRNSFPSFDLLLSDECKQALDVEPYEYCSGDIVYSPSDNSLEDLVFTNVGIRLKGRASFRSLNEKPAFKIKFDEFVKGQRMLGLRRLTLNNMVQDPAMARERMGYWIFREAGLEAPMCNHAKVYLNGEYLGLYANIQTLDDVFVEDIFNDAPGNLYDTNNEEYFVDFLPRWFEHFELETNNDLSDKSDLTALIEAVAKPNDTFFKDVGQVLDWDQFLTVGAAQTMIADWDGYFGARNNYKLYHELDRNRFILLSWGIDQTFGLTDDHFDNHLWYLNYELDGSSSLRDNGYVFERCREILECMDLYMSKIGEVLEVWNSLRLEEELDFILAQTAQAKEDDTKKPYSDRRSALSAESLRTFLQQRGEIVSSQLSDSNPAGHSD